MRGGGGTEVGPGPPGVNGDEERGAEDRRVPLGRWRAAAGVIPADVMSVFLKKFARGNSCTLGNGVRFAQTRPRGQKRGHGVGVMRSAEMIKYAEIVWKNNRKNAGNVAKYDCAEKCGKMRQNAGRLPIPPPLDRRRSESEGCPKPHSEQMTTNGDGSGISLRVSARRNAVWCATGGNPTPGRGPPHLILYPRKVLEISTLT